MIEIATNATKLAGPVMNKRGDTRALICMYTGDERRTLLHIDEFCAGMPLSAEAECLSHFNS
jgi:hypothetical protein